MINLVVVIFGSLILGGIFLRKYLALEKGIYFSSFFFRKTSGVAQLPAAQELNEITVEELIPDSEEIDLKNKARADSLVRKGEIYLGKDDLNTAAKCLIEALSLNPGSIKAHEKLALVYLRQGNFTKAENIYRKLVLTVNDDPSYFSNLGMSLFSQEKLEEAKKFYCKALELDNTRAGRFFSLAQINCGLDETEDALANFKKASEMDPRNLDYSLCLAKFYLDNNLLNEAKQLLSEILLQDPKNEVAADLIKQTL